MPKKEEPLQPGDTAAYDDGELRFSGVVAMNIGGSVHICSGNNFYALKEDDPHLSLVMRAHENLEV